MGLRKYPPDRKAKEKLLAALDPRFRSPLISMYRGEQQLGADGRRYPIMRTGISPSQGMWLYNLCVSVKPKSTIEIGMAYGYSTIFFLAAISKNRFGRHIAIDPLQHAYWKGIGLAHTQALAPPTASPPSFQLIEDRSDRAATDLARSNLTFEVIFIDGNHRFDDVLVDFYLYAPLCTIGGHIIFDDVRMSSIQTVVAFVRANRADFVEIPTDETNICVFRKIRSPVRSWKHFRRFTVSQSTD
ncbi:MAG: class I SAM-dependent methyltransferase [Elusimicrobia bacterium]|nr:class I SAM-dependent methyltransferase [Elusimicrobiota bacterium]